ncbi:uncharacterized protein LOC134282621 [Saccostrea cucullata]|uniref:uncharacterized protein LOC134282621 n=1 Tax=Saccostrea cuccullata TaxID=36930 RepID=UPI002ED43159
MISSDHHYIVLPNATQDGTKCMIACKITADVRAALLKGYNEWYPAPYPSERKDGYFYISKRFYCQRNPYYITVDLRGYCDYRIYKKRNFSIGEKCNSDEQCYNSKCSMNECSCEDSHTRFQDQCVRDDMLENGAFYGDQCLFSEQCIFPGGVCSKNQTCSCRSDYVYNVERKTCYQDDNLLEVALGAGISSSIVGVVVGLVVMFLIQKSVLQDTRQTELRSNDLTITSPH